MSFLLELHGAPGRSALFLAVSCEVMPLFRPGEAARPGWLISWAPLSGYFVSYVSLPCRWPSNARIFRPAHADRNATLPSILERALRCD